MSNFINGMLINSISCRSNLFCLIHCIMKREAIVMAVAIRNGSGMNIVLPMSSLRRMRYNRQSDFTQNNIA